MVWDLNPAKEWRGETEIPAGRQLHRQVIAYYSIGTFQILVAFRQGLPVYPLYTHTCTKAMFET